jgi:hypothetical protein
LSGSELAISPSSKHPVQHGIAQDPVLIPAFAGRAIEVLPYRLGIVNEIGEVQLLTPARGLKPVIGAVRPLAEAPSAFMPDRRMPGKTVIRVTGGR